MRHVLILGGTSAIATAAARLFAADGDRLHLVDLDKDRLEATAEDLTVRGAASCTYAAADLMETDKHAAIIDAAEKKLDGLDTVLLAYGTLSKQAECEADAALTLRELSLNFTSAASLLTIVANRLEARGSGRIGVISSVAGDRGRRSNYVYGSAKAGLTAFCSGLRARLSGAGVSVTTIKPGLVDSPMTAEFDNKGALWSNPEKVGAKIYKAMEKGKGDVYVPWFWWPIMFIIRSLPEFIFKKLKF